MHGIAEKYSLFGNYFSFLIPHFSCLIISDANFPENRTVISARISELARGDFVDALARPAQLRFGSPPKPALDA